MYKLRDWIPLEKININVNNYGSTITFMETKNDRSKIVISAKSQ